VSEATVRRTGARAVAASLLVLCLLVPSSARAGGGAVGLRGAEVGPRGTETVKIKMKDGARRRFASASLTIARGTKVKWVNAGNLTHTTTSDGDLWDERLPPGQTFVRRFRRAGTFPFHCSIHPEMTGTIRVT
jgi:plastocyanin